MPRVDANMNLTEQRRAAAEQTWIGADLDGKVKDAGAWIIDGDNWSRKVFWEDEVEVGGVGSFGLRFKEGTDEVDDTWTNW